VDFLDKFSRKPLGKAEFAQLVLRAFEKSGITGIEYREEEFAFKIPGRDATIFLHNSYQNYCQAPREKRGEIISQLIASFAEIPEIPKDFSSAKPHLMPVVRDAANYYFGQLMQRASGALDPGFVWQAKLVAEGLVTGLAYDSENSITTVNRQTLDDWGVGIDEAFTCAKDNLWERTDPSRMVGKNGIYWGEWGDSYDSSRMLFPELIYRLALDGDPVAYVPNRDSLFVTGKNNAAGLRTILKTGGETHFNQGHPVSPDLYLLEESTWKVYVPQDLELRSLWMATKRRRDALDYAQQKQALDKLPAYADVFVASMNLLTRDDGSVFSVCVWPRDIATLLPRAEVIAFVLDEESNHSVMVLWDAAIPIIGGLLQEEPGLIPVRYRAPRFPSDDQIAQLRRVARNPK
jgi:hypothetical protein